MKPLTLEQIATAVGGSLDQADPQAIVTGAAADSRLLSPGDLFVAIVGDRVDGHDYAAAAFESGAVAVLAQRPIDGPAILVADPVTALGSLAHHLLTLLPNMDVVAVTGSSGKTSTKDMLAAVFASRGPVVAPAGSFNSEVGLPLTVLRCDDSTRTLVLEMGARGIGRIHHFVRYAFGTEPEELTEVRVQYVNISVYVRSDGARPRECPLVAVPVGERTQERDLA